MYSIDRSLTLISNSLMPKSIQQDILSLDYLEFIDKLLNTNFLKIGRFQNETFTKNDETKKKKINFIFQVIFNISI